MNQGRLTLEDTIKLAVVGAGLVGRRHIEVIQQSSQVELAAIVDPNVSDDFTAPVFKNLAAMFESMKVDGVVLSTPTLLHVDGALQCIAENVAVLIEKPLATSVGEARTLVQAATKAGVPILVGHHRRHNPIIKQAKTLIEKGTLGSIRGIQATCWFYKPDDYFDVAPWRKEPGAGPISVNMVHDVDLMRHFCGEVVSVQAQMSPSIRGYANEELGATLLRFESGALCTMTVSDSIVSPWNWEMTSREYPIYPVTDQSSYLIGGSDASLSIPDMRLWRHDGMKSWWNPMSATTMPRTTSDPLVNQIVHFAAVIRGYEHPLVSGEEGLRTLAVVEAIQHAAKSGETVNIEPSERAEHPQKMLAH
jgi:predicted dehydrogenase